MSICFETWAQEKLTPAQQFTRDIVNKATSLAAIPPEFIMTSNPHVKPYGATLATARWGANTIYVCWENPDPAFSEAMSWVREAVRSSWEKYSKLKFPGWEKCASLSTGIRIQIIDEGPRTETIGHYLDGMKNGMKLNFTFSKWGDSCKQTLEYCVKAIAVHEFGHAIGFTHEQNRPDAPGECRLLSQATDPDKLLTPYDPNSVMNYCNKKYNNGGILSSLDIQAVQTLYKAP
ncbi:M12 family metallopeptidase [Cupriavidus necator]|uniref:M12 family metallopeptidase n=1 Tax=Cupriavidus necator TaxID=106590 RepID=UPI0039C3A430